MTLANEDLLPVPPDRRTWNWWHIASLWIGMAICIPTYTLASGLMASGWTWQAAVGAVVLGNFGMLELERGNINEAIDAFTRGLHAPDRSKDQEAALCYEIGAAYEAKKMVKPALEHFQRTARLVPSYRDVQERVRRLQRVEPKQPQRAVAVGADDEFDRAFLSLAPTVAAASTPVAIAPNTGADTELRTVTVFGTRFGIGSQGFLRMRSACCWRPAGMSGKDLTMRGSIRSF